MSISKTPSVNQASQGGMVYAKNTVTKEVERIAVVSGMQIGLPVAPKDLQLFGGISYSIKLIKIVSGESYNMDNNTSYLMVDISGGSGNVTIYLPPTPRTGQSIYIKDYSGNCDVVGLVVTAGETSQRIEGSYTRTINTRRGYLGLIWNGNDWSVVAEPPKISMNFGCSTTRTGANTDYLNPGGVSISAGTSDTRRQPSPTSGTIRNISVVHNVAGTTSAGTAELTYTVLINGTASSVSVAADVTSTSTVSNTTNRAVVAAGDLVSVEVDIPANVNNAPDRIVVTFEIVS
jgi:hypothetical protein